jgi:osmotically inducible protein OsmC
MADIIRKASAVWTGDLRHGQGRIATDSGVLDGVGYSFATRFENEPGTNPEELIAAAHAACYSMAFANTLKQKGYAPQSIETHASCTLKRLEEGGFKIAKMSLKARGKVPGLDDATFKEIAREADKGCPVSNLLHPGLEIELDAALA